MNTEELGALVARADAQRERLLTTVEEADARRHPRVRSIVPSPPVAVVALATMGVVGLAMAWMGARRARPPTWTLLAAAAGASGVALSVLVATHHASRATVPPPMLAAETKVESVVMLPELEGPVPKPVTRRAWFWVLASLLILLAARLSLGS